MKTEQRNRLINTAIVLLGHTDDKNVIHLTQKSYLFDMSLFAIDELGEEVYKPEHMEACGTSCCVVGLGALLYPDILKYNQGIDWNSLSGVLFGIYSYKNVEAWKFIFNFDIKSDPIELANRIIHYLKGYDLDSFSMVDLPTNKQVLHNQLIGLME